MPVSGNDPIPAFPALDDELETAISDLDLETLRRRLPNLAHVPDLDAVDFGRFSELASIPVDAERMVFVLPSAVKESPDGGFAIDPGMYPPEALLAKVDWSVADTDLTELTAEADWRRQAFESALRGSVENVWIMYYRDRVAEIHGPKATSSPDEVTAQHLRAAAQNHREAAQHLCAAARGLRQRGDEELAGYMEGTADAERRLRVLSRGEHEGLAKFLEGAAHHLHPKKRRQKGSALFRSLLRHLVLMVEHLGGHLAFLRSNATGSPLFQLINELSKLLPPTFVREWQYTPMSYLEKLGTAVRNSLGEIEHQSNEVAKSEYLVYLRRRFAEGVNALWGFHAKLRIWRRPGRPLHPRQCRHRRQVVHKTLGEAQGLAEFARKVD